MASAPSTVLIELSDHLQKVETDPSTSLDEQLLEKCQLYTSTPEYRGHEWKNSQSIFFQVARLLPNLQQDPAPLNDFVLKLSAPYRFDDVKDLDFRIGLDLAAKPFHHLILSLLEKAAASEIDSEKLANQPDVVRAVVRLWLCTDDAGIATKAGDLLVSLLTVSKNLSQGSPAYGRGPMWKRIFEDKDVYGLFYVFCSMKSLPSNETPLSKRDKTLAQARLFDWLPIIGSLSWDAITTSHHRDIERAVGLSGDQGLLHFAATRMVDKEDDILMHMSLINFYSDLISTIRIPTTSGNSSVALDFLKQHQLHQEIMGFYTADEADMGIEQSFLGSRVANYVSVYVSTYPDDFEDGPEVQKIRERSALATKKCEPDHLHVLASMPRTSLVPRISNRLEWTECPVFSLPITRTNPDALKTLATIFHGPMQEEITFPAISSPPSSPRHTAEQFYARLITAYYYLKHPTMFSDLIHHADTIAMADTALAALLLLRAIITSKWSTLTPPNFPSDESTLHVLQQLEKFPKSGVELVLDPTISGGVLPYLLKPATTFSGLVGGVGEAESAAYRVAMAKFDVLKALGERMQHAGVRHEVDSMVRRRIAEGPWGNQNSAGSRIGTLEM
ncbi:hypothetical protein GQ43DRAFT_170224 [Delitschia confertaspora ATCC 74209]|uniref:Uncharacterized protein n=1 Tax=Delitschia confertaspora ATCC 74209 TaxID=1513339 RepID=A0A9P4JFE2_9PLEO|nr:hypothetical protein GQ43DRAFT_170224 [Delitschia confertaspora ATCC 74209]